MVEFRFANRVAGIEAPVALVRSSANTLRLSAGSGCPQTLPDLSAEAELASRKYKDETLQYGPLFGLDALRDGLAAFLAEDGIVAQRDNIIVVNGGKQALELIGRAFLDRGDVVVVTAPTFLTTISIFAFEGASFISIAQDGEGMIVEDLEAVLRERARQGLPSPKLVFDMPDFHNPTGITMPEGRRKRLVELADEYDFLIIEDDPYRRVRFSGAPVPPIKTFDPEGRVIGVGTMAKILSPGLKVGWVNAAPSIIKRLAAIKMDGGSSPFAQRLVALLIENGRLSEIIATITAEMRVRRDAMAKAFAQRLPQAKFSTPNGGYFLWVEMPETIDCDLLARIAETHGVSVFSGTHCFANEPRRNFLRLSYSFCTPRELDEGVARLAAAYGQMSTMRGEQAVA